MELRSSRAEFRVRDYHLDATLTSGQAFRWRPVDGGWQGVVGDRVVRLAARPGAIEAEVWPPIGDWQWLWDYLQLEVDLETVLRSFPADAPLCQAVRTWRGLRLLRQDPWECLASFVLSSTKRITQIQQVIERLCACHGAPIPGGPKGATAFTFPTPDRLADCAERELRACGMGFRAPYLREIARRWANGSLSASVLREGGMVSAGAALRALPGVGPKIADCVLLFAGGYLEAFPVDVWVTKALRAWYFAGRQVNQRQLRQFAASHFGPYAGYAQQYLFHAARTGRELAVTR